MLRQRIFSGAAMLAALFSAATLLPAFGIGLLILALALMGLIEYCRLMQHAGLAVFGITMGVGALLITGGAFMDLLGTGLATTHLSGFSAEGLAIAVMLLVLITRAFSCSATPATLYTVAASIMGLLYLPLLLNFYMRLALTEMIDGAPSAAGRLLALFPIVVVKVSDMGAFFAGRRFGHRKLCPSLSPGKTLEGLIGGLAAGIAVALLFVCCFRLPSARLAGLWRPLPLAASAVILTLFGVAGDLAESLFKRIAGVKDSSGVLPGMGGVLDVLDSLLFSGPAFYLIVIFASRFT